MAKTNVLNSAAEDYVEVINEPLHVELFQNEYIRLYNASLPPGTATMFHRHCEDTVYIVHEGGEISTENFSGSPKSPTILPKSFSLYKKILMGARLKITGAVKLPKSLFFCILSKNQPIVHRAVTSKNNINKMELMGIEIVKSSGRGNSLSPGKGHYKKEFENANFAVYNFKLKPGETKDQMFRFPGVMVITAGKVEYRYPDTVNSSYNKLESGAFLWHEIDTVQTLINKSEKPFEALIIEIK